MKSKIVKFFMIAFIILSIFTKTGAEDSVLNSKGIATYNELDMHGQKIINLAIPSTPREAVNKLYVDSINSAIQAQLRSLQNQINNLQLQVKQNRNACQPGYTFSNGECLPNANFRP